MGCIDVFTPEGNLLSIGFLLEQIWLHGDKNGMRATEVYDILVIADEQPVKELYILLPHFCRSLDGAGVWHDHVVLQVPGKSSPWGWLYSAEEEQQGRLVLTVPDPKERVGPGVMSLPGRTMPLAKIEWHPKLTDAWLEVMRRIRKSLYIVDLGGELSGSAGEGCWLRLIVQPQEFDLPMVVERSRGPGGLFRTDLQMEAYVTCPALVRKMFVERLNNAVKDLALDAIHVQAVRELVISRGFRSEMGGLRIEDHRLVLAGYNGLTVFPRQPAETIDSLGTQPIRSDWTGAIIPPGIDWPASVVTSRAAHFYCGGSRTQSVRDLVAVVHGILAEAGYGAAKSKEVLAKTMTPSHYREGCFLIDVMVEKRLLRVDGGNYIPMKLSRDEQHKRVCEVRRFYADATNFQRFPQAQAIFRDLHPFRLDFNARWRLSPLWLLILTWVFGLSGLASLTIHVIQFLLRIR